MAARRSGSREPGETDWLQSVTREVKAVRSAVGVCDVSTLGKIDIQGPDAGAFLDRVYINTFSTLPVGKARYGVMLREDGFVMDDGTTARFGPEHYVMSTTTANAAKVMQHLEFCHQVLWPELDVADRLGHRAMGAVRRRRPASSRALLQTRARIGARSLERGLSLSRLRGPSGSARCPARLFRHLVLGRTRLRDRRAGALWRQRWFAR